MGRLKKKVVQNKEDVILVDGYYLPADIAEPFKRLRDYCLKELVDLLDSFCQTVDVTYTECGYVVEAIDNEWVYKIALFPHVISQIEKAIGTKKLQAYLDTIKTTMTK